MLRIDVVFVSSLFYSRTVPTTTNTVNYLQDNSLVLFYELVKEIL